MTRITTAALLCAALMAVQATKPALAQTHMMTIKDSSGHGMVTTDKPHSGPHGGMMKPGHGAMHGPARMMGNHLMPAGKVMLGYSFGAMSMSGNRIGTTEVSDAFVATQVPNVFFGAPGQPPTLRIVPQEMTMQMHMFGLMYAPTDRLTLMAMLPWVEKSMTSTTYAGAAGTTVLGRSKMRSEGLGDIRVGGTFGLMRDQRSQLLFGMTMSLPTGSITETGTMLSPMGMQMTRRMAYPMQLGSGTYDLMPTLSYRSGKGRFNYGAQLRGTVRLGSNDEGYSLGDEVAAAAWASYKPAPLYSVWGKIEAARLGRIDGRDALIAGPMQGANPAFQGGDTVTLTAGIDFTLQDGPLKGHRIGLDIGAPIYQDLNGPRLGTDWVLGASWRKMF
ncbi:transporter [Roseovarius nanhaiticus]|uniref:transporter n=1 Tax=Roseovarius nanhaiticus TaxID=573024 RepID=UPI0024924019|nr:transporter [Roseovarius nanhaiticus]